VIIHTAAVQGKPRGAVLSQENIILSNLQLINTFGLSKSKTYLNILPLFHIMGVNLGLAALMAGGKNVILEKFNPQQAVELIQEQKVNFLGSFPPILSLLLEVIEKGNYDLSSLEIAAGLEMPDMVKKWEAATNATFWTMYGQTETSGLISFSEYFKQPGSAGEISLLANLKIADEFDNHLPCGATGEILVKGPLVFKGYWNAPELNELTFRGGWHHTGDLGMVDSQGFLFFKGRKAERELIKPGGENVFPAEVEKAIIQHGSVKSVCVFGVPDPKFGEGIKAIVSLLPGKRLTKEELIKFTGSLIAGYKKPRYIEFIDQLPRTEDGSIDRIKIKKDFS
jgi:acyl-CoA synthetase (AMP-forming)/AMP-acid ligase II